MMTNAQHQQASHDHNLSRSLDKINQNSQDQICVADLGTENIQSLFAKLTWNIDFLTVSWQKNKVVLSCKTKKGEKPKRTPR